MITSRRVVRRCPDCGKPVFGTPLSSAVVCACRRVREYTFGRCIPPPRPNISELHTARYDGWRYV